MDYIFEKGTYPNFKKVEDKEFSTNEEAIKYALENDFDYIWNCTADDKTTWTWRKQKDKTS